MAGPIHIAGLRLEPRHKATNIQDYCGLIARASDFDTNYPKRTVPALMAWDVGFLNHVITEAQLRQCLSFRPSVVDHLLWYVAGCVCCQNPTLRRQRLFPRRAQDRVYCKSRWIFWMPNSPIGAMVQCPVRQTKKLVKRTLIIWSRCRVWHGLHYLFCVQYQFQQVAAAMRSPAVTQIARAHVPSNKCNFNLLFISFFLASNLLGYSQDT
jgi:hypothetical protein